MSTLTYSLRPSGAMAKHAPRLKSALASFGPDFLPILTRKQIDRSLRLAKRYTTTGGGRSNEHKRQRPAAVLVPLCTVRSVPSVLFTLRSSTLSTHAGQISFPGGHADCGERGSPVETALRETREELLGHHDADDDNDDDRGGGGDAGGSSSVASRLYDFDSGIEILGQTGRVPSMRGQMVTPIVGALTYDLPSYDAVAEIFPGNEGEVEEVFAMSVQSLIENETSEELKRLGPGVMGPVFPAGEGRGKIWGLTAIILRHILHKILKPAGFVGGGDSSCELKSML